MFHKAYSEPSKHKKHWGAIALASAAALAAVLLASGTVQAEDTPNRSGNREIGIYDPDVPDIEDDDSIFDEVQPAPQPQEPSQNAYTGPYYIMDESGQRIRNKIVLYEGQYYGTNRYGVAYKVTDDPAEQIPTDLKNSFYTSPTGNVYYFDEKGQRVTTFFAVDGKQYFFDDYGRLVRNRFVPFWEFYFYIGEDGTPYQDGLYKIGKNYYKFDKMGILAQNTVIDYKGKQYSVNRFGVVNIKDEEVTP
ncbi:hypothetical protein ACVRXQ_00965 [Streptococcus panodentis]|uniref:Glucosyl transferase n=1 Tax=Streptococcus panodentis TaxID=1581472 RepID=A0ABS5ATE0_9STRE|nr:MULTISPECIES: hypothetical protein [Streptococcus]KXT80973.1 hypothetical protein STRDD11_02101 [Streptococcus sp. DD11]MBP2619835.1 hypothetical protein [Streptococcus panodentis]